MGRSATLEVKIKGDASGADRALDRTSGKLGKLGGVAGAAAAGGLATVVAGAGAVGVAGGKMASGLEQSVGAIDTVFKGGAGQMHDYAKAADQSAGLTQNAYNELGTLIGTQLKNGGTATDELAGKTNQLIGTGADLASMFGGDTQTAVEALSSALKGERDPIEKYGVSLTQAAIDAKAAELGFSKVGGALSAEANQAATLSLIMEQTADAHGNFAKEADTAAGKQERMVASAKNLVTNLGTLLLPLMTLVFGFMNDTAIPAIEALVGAFTAAGGGGGLAAKLGLEPIITIAQQIGATAMPVLTALSTQVLPPVGAALASLGQPLLAVATAVLGLVAAVAGRLQPVVLALLPVVVTVFQGVVSVVKGALAVVSGVITTVTALIRGDWSGAWEGIKSTASAAVALVGTIVSAGVDNLSAIWSAGLDTVVGFIAELPGKVGRWAAQTADDLVDKISRGWDDTKTATSTKIGEVVDYVSELPGRILTGLGDLSSLLTSAGRDLVSGFLGGIGDMATAAADKAGEVAAGAVARVKSILGINSPSKVFRDLGRDTGKGMVLGLQGQARSVQKAASDLVGTPERLARKAPAVPIELASGTRGDRGRGDTRPTVQIIVQGAVDPVSTARQIRQLLHDEAVLVGRPA